MAFVKLVRVDDSVSWAEVELLEGDTVARLADRACAKFRSWDADASQVSLYLVERTGEDVPSPAAESAALDGKPLQPTWSLAHARIVPSSCILVRKTAGAAAAGACACMCWGRPAHRSPSTPSQTRLVGVSTSRRLRLVVSAMVS